MRTHFLVWPLFAASLAVAPLVRAEVITRAPSARAVVDSSGEPAGHRIARQHISARLAESVEPANLSSALSHSRPEPLIPTSMEHGNGFLGGYVRDPESLIDAMPVRKARGTMIHLGTLGGDVSAATSINTRGQVVGHSETK
jgi:hypothetical protein